MKAIVYTKYGSPDVLQLQELAVPVPLEDEVLIKVEAASLNAYDWHMLTADIFLVRLAAGLLKPNNTLLGADIAGRVEAVGAKVTRFQPGDAVFGQARHASGGFAEYVCARETALAKKPANCTFEEAAAVPMAGFTALQGLRDVGRVQAGQKVLINGAAGGVGTFAVQIARVLGAEVTAVCSARNLDTARALGAGRVIDYAQEDFTKNGQAYDLILAANGYHSIFAYRRSLAPLGIYVMAGGSFAQMFQSLTLGPLITKTGLQKMSVVSAKVSQPDLLFLQELLETGKIKAVIDRRYPLGEVPEALRYLGAGHARGKVIISVGPDFGSL